MTPVERLRAAIDKLEQLREERRYYETRAWLVEVVTVGTEDSPQQEESPITNDELIVTLHRTIDVQLAILRHTHARVGSKLHRGALPSAVWSTERDGLALADAILGEA